MISADMKVDIIQQEIKEMAAVSHNFYKKHLQNLE